MGSPVLRLTESAVQTSSDDESDHSDFFDSEPLLQVKSETSPGSRQFHTEGAVHSSDDESDSIDSRESTLSLPSEAISEASPPSFSSDDQFLPIKQLNSQDEYRALPSVCQVRISSPTHPSLPPFINLKFFTTARNVTVEKKNNFGKPMVPEG